ncbi:alpha/beta fold hydrolase [Rhodobacteraceae bacterium 2CG4]|uniref:Alpha/beta fold hydrolase n=1 Tax=Halovulum marinum TaxID=2662447 RepID=A0A6L5Z6V8_9RHOB|nr:alpha/beta hydrolase [Halovulum marinum]MSU92291.1 alpha/beta fold hydrolase [Halovulum marinum]
MSGRFTTSDGLSLAYEDDGGAGTPLLCLAGLTRNARDFDDLAAVRPDGVRMVRLTARGREPSDYDPDPAHYQLPVEARDAVELLDHLRIDRAVIVGTSRGGLIALLLAATAKPRLAGVLLNDIGPEINPAGLQRIADYVGVTPAVRTLDEAAAALLLQNRAAFPKMRHADWRRLAERWFRIEADGLGLRYDPALAQPLRAGGAQPVPDMWPLFDALAGVPLACVRGAHSDILSAATLAAMQARRPDMIAAIVPDRGHVPFLDEPEALRALQQLLAKVRG